MSTKLSSCCVTGHLHSGNPEGGEATVGGQQAYVVGNGNKVLLFITDIFGYKLNNVRLAADEYAKTGGFKVVVPDFFDGDHVPIKHMKALTPLKSDPTPSEEEKGKNMQAAFGDVGPWLERHGDDKVNPKLEKVLDELAGSGSPVGVVGFCWGGRHAVILAGGNSKVAAAVANHPSYTEMTAWEKVSKPILVQCGDDDSLFPADQVKQVEDSIFPGKQDAQITVFPGAVHGWTIRGDQNNDDEKKQKDNATEAAIQFLQKHL